jgi:hypothetical protein
MIRKYTIGISLESSNLQWAMHRRYNLEFNCVFGFLDMGFHVFLQNTATFLLRHYVILNVM